MTSQELNSYVGKTLSIRGSNHLCLAAGHDALLLLQICGHDEPLLKAGEPVQYIVARRPSLYGGTLVWDQGAYFPILAYRNEAGDATAKALWNAALRLAGRGTHDAFPGEDADASQPQ